MGMPLNIAGRGEKMKLIEIEVIVRKAGEVILNILARL